MEITTSTSTQRFSHKPTQEEKKNLHFEVKTITVEQLYHHVINGGAFNNIYDLKGTFMFKGKGIKTDHYIGTQTINIDLDHQNEPKSAKNGQKMNENGCFWIGKAVP